ncbi:MAG: CidA/LrgA family protein [Duncaniella sp.]|nr:CidA/LrgA family protein [Duncaniella sp.]
MVKQCFIIFGCLAVGEFLVWLTGISVPGSILGMLLLTLLLDRHIIKVNDVAPMCHFLISNMGLFFVPPGVALMLYFDVIADSWPAITVATVVSTVLVLLVTGRVHQFFRHAVHRK